MTRTVYFDSVARAIGVSAWNHELQAIENPGSLTPTSLTATIAASDTVAFAFAWAADTGFPGMVDWPVASAGDPYQAQIDVDAISSDITISAGSNHWGVNSGLTTGLFNFSRSWSSTSGTGLKTCTNTSMNPAAQADDTHRAFFPITVGNANSMMSQDITLNLGTTDTWLKGPWVATSVPAFRGYADDGAINAATPKAAQNTDWDQALDETFRVRFLIQQGGLASDPVNQFSYHYRRNGGSWFDLTTTSSFVRIEDSVTTEGATTSILSGGAGTFGAGRLIESSTSSDGDAVPAGGYTEHAVNLIMDSADGWADGDTLEVRVMHTALNLVPTSMVIPVITVTAGGGGTEFTQPLSATLSFTVTAVKKGRKPLTASISPAGAIVRETRRALTATLGPSGSLARKTRRALTGTLSFTGSATASLRKLLALSATLGFSGSVSREGRKVLAGSLAPAGSLTRRARKALAGSLSPAGAITRRTRRALAAVLDFAGAFNGVLQGGAEQFEEAFNASLDFTATVTRRTGKALAATLSPAAALAAAGRFRRALTATLTPSGALRRSTGRGLAAVLDFDAALTRRVDKLLSATLSPAGDLTAQLIGALAIAFNATLSFTTAAQARTSKVLDAVAASLDFSGSLATASVFHRALTASLDFAGSINRRTRRSISAALSPAATLSKETRRALAATLDFAGSLAGEFTGTLAIAFNATLSFSGSVARRTSHRITAVLSPAGSLAKNTSRAIAASLSTSAALARRTGHRIAATLAPSATMTRRVRRSLAATLSPAAALARSLTRRLSVSASLDLTSALTRSTSRAFSAALTPAGALNRLTRRALSATVSFVGAIVTRAITPLRSRGQTAARTSGAIVSRVRTAVSRSSGSTSSRDRGSTGPRD